MIYCQHSRHLHLNHLLNNMLKKIIYIFLSTLILMSAAIWNRFPLIYPDVGTYIASGFMPEMPIDRPITYGIFMWLTSLGGTSLWGTVFAQALMTVLVIRYFLKGIADSFFDDSFLPIGVGLLTVFTGIAFPVGQLIPDFATPVMLLSLLMLVAQVPLEKPAKRILYLFFFLTNAMHISHILLNISLLSLFGLFIGVRRKHYPFLKFRPIGILFLLCVLGIGTMGAPLSKSSHVFRMGTLVHNHILQPYLTEKCPTHHYRLCDFEQQIPHDFDAFVWGKTSPLYQIGWRESKSEFRTILFDIYTTPKYLKQIISTSFRNTIKQLQTFQIGEGNLPFATSEPFIQTMEQYCHTSMAYTRSRQFQTIPFIPKSLHDLHTIIVLLSFLGVILYGLRSWNRDLFKKPIFLLILGILVILLTHAWVIATFSLPQNRFGCRVIWLLPLCGIALIPFNYLQNKIMKKQIRFN